MYTNTLNIPKCSDDLACELCIASWKYDSIKNIMAISRFQKEKKTETIGPKRCQSLCVCVYSNGMEKKILPVKISEKMTVRIRAPNTHSHTLCSKLVYINNMCACIFTLAFQWISFAENSYAQSVIMF